MIWQSIHSPQLFTKSFNWIARGHIVSECWFFRNWPYMHCQEGFTYSVTHWTQLRCQRGLAASNKESFKWNFGTSKKGYALAYTINPCINKAGMGFHAGGDSYHTIHLHKVRRRNCQKINVVVTSSVIIDVEMFLDGICFLLHSSSL